MTEMQPPPHELDSSRLSGWLRDMWSRLAKETIGGTSDLIIKLDENGNLNLSSLDSNKILEDTDVTGDTGEIDVAIPVTGSITIGISDLFLAAHILGTINQITVTDNGDGSVTLSLPQDIDTNADVVFDTSLVDILYLKDLNQYFQENSGDVELVTGANKTLLLNQVVYEDLQVSISNIRLPTSNMPTWRQYNHGIVGGVTFPVLGFATGDIVYFDIQTHHAMKLSTVLDNHIHFCTPTDGSATPDRFQFQLDVIAAPINVNWAALTGSPFTAEHTIAADYTNLHKLFEIADFPAVNTTVSTIYKCRLERIAATQDEYGSEVYLEFTDCHYQKDTVGSRQEGTK